MEMVDGTSEADARLAKCRQALEQLRRRAGESVESNESALASDDFKQELDWAKQVCCKRS